MVKTQGEMVTVYDVTVPQRDELKFLVVFPGGGSVWYARVLIRAGTLTLKLIDGRPTITLPRRMLPEEYDHVEDAEG